MNLISNAVKFTPGGGQIKVKGKFIKSVQDLSVHDDLFEDILN